MPGCVDATPRAVASPNAVASEEKSRERLRDVVDNLFERGRDRLAFGDEAVTETVSFCAARLEKLRTLFWIPLACMAIVLASSAKPGDSAVRRYSRLSRLANKNCPPPSVFVSSWVESARRDSLIVASGD
jgi:hypothetical protein